MIARYHPRPLVATYDAWRDTVNIASRMQTHSQRGRVQRTDTTAELLKDEFILDRRYPIRVRDKGCISPWFLIGRKHSE